MRGRCCGHKRLVNRAGVLMLQTNAISIWASQQAGSGAAGLLTATVLDSDGNSFTVNQRVYNSGTNSFIVAADVKDSDGNDFTIFT
jgi:hypothetical protein